MTRQRQAIWELIQSFPGHPTAEQIYQLAKQKLPKLAIGTVYRNLGLMVQDGTLRRVETPDGPDCYDKNTAPHEHFRCIRCGALSDVDIVDLKQFLQQQSGEEILSYQLSVQYVCRACRNLQVGGDKP